MKKFVGVDCHKNTLACYQDNRFQEFPNTKEGFKAATQWASKGSSWALEGAYCYGKAFC
jgi:hypothetical protein